MKFLRIDFRESFRKYFAGADCIRRKTQQRMFYSLRLFIPDMERYCCEPGTGGGYDVFVEKKGKRVCIGSSVTNISFPKEDVFYYRKELADFDAPYQMLDAHSFDRMANAYFHNRIPRRERADFKYRCYLIAENYDCWKRKQQEFAGGMSGLKITGTNSHGQRIEITAHSLYVKKLHCREGQWFAGSKPVTVRSHFVVFTGIKKEMFDLFLKLLDKYTDYGILRLTPERIGCWNTEKNRWEVNGREYKP
jgi:hypothetical protein